ncbi:ABC transporter permease subunit [Paenibacillus sp. NFR01]|uniref:ABC transporter permease subunit n=1 Tax=Paenibacillus sp. NFR01 TaxID=1566279 RepID=UPI0008C0753F|nr:ABC transporter permease subunit [Paenibacillus sp. NFR01]SET89421.1 ABC-2 type transport system permease protein [Paenibacillus sp. NFR01]
MNLTLYKQMLKVNLKGIMNYAVGSAFYILFMIWLYPGIGKNTDALNDLVSAMPAGVNNAFGLTNGFSNFEAFISGEYYGLILVLILAVVCVQMSTQLMARLVDRGSMAYLLTAPTTRRKVATTQALVLATALFLIMAVTTAAGFAGNAIFLKGDYEFDSGRFLQLNTVAFLLFFAVGAISFLVSCAANDEKKALGISGALVFIFFTLDLLGKISDKLDALRYFTLFTLYRPGDIVGGTADIPQSCIVLALVGLAAFLLGIQLFRRRDLPL